MIQRLCVLLAAIVAASCASSSEDGSFASVTDGLTHKPGFLDLYVNEGTGAILAALPAPDDDGACVRFIYTTGLTAGLGSNPIGLDRGNAGDGVIIRFRKIGDRVVAEQENWRYRASADNAREKLAVAQSFATSFLWSTPVKAVGPEGALLIDLTDFLVRDQFAIADALEHGDDAAGYRLARERSFPDPKNALAFPDNIELDAFLTFDTDAPNAQTSETAPDARSITLVQHHSFVRLPDEDYKPRAFDQRTANIGFGFYDYSSPLADPIVRRFSRRFRLERQDPNATSGPVKKPIVFYIDGGAPQPIREALAEGASWWAEGFEAAGFEDAYRVEILPEGAHPLDVRYNVINWVHRQTRGWSYGGSVSDPRTGEILKANVILGSQRVRQDRMIFEGLAGAAKTGTGDSDDPVEISLARIRQLSAHEVGHTLGFAHNFAASANDRASVMDYPAPYVRPTSAGTIDFSQAYAVGLGAWDIFTVKWLYGQFADGVDETAALDKLVRDADNAGLRFVSDRHGRAVSTAHPLGSVWDNGDDPVQTLRETMAVRRIALKNFGPSRLADGRPLSDLNAVIVPVYLYHRYQTAAAAKLIGGIDFKYGVNGKDAAPATPVSPTDQRQALAALLETLSPEALDLDDATLNWLTPGAVGYASLPVASETFADRTGPVFDLLGAGEVAASLTLSSIFNRARLERLLALEQRDENTLTLQEVVAETDRSVFAPASTPRHESLARVVQAEFINALINIARDEKASPALVYQIDGALGDIRQRLRRQQSTRALARSRHLAGLANQIGKYLDSDAPATQSPLPTPPGSPIGADEAFGQHMETCWHCETVDFAGRRKTPTNPPD